MLYYRHSVGRPGSMKVETLRQLRQVRAGAGTRAGGQTAARASGAGASRTLPLTSRSHLTHPPAQRIPERVLEKAVKGMLPKGRIGRHLFNHLKVRARTGEGGVVARPCSPTALPNP